VVWDDLYFLPLPHYHSSLLWLFPFSDEKVTETGAVEPDKDHVREEPLSLPDKFTWDDVNLSDSAQVWVIH